MRNEQNAVLASLRRAQQFLDTNSDILDAVNKSTRKQLDDVVTELTDLSIAQEGSLRGSKGETARQRTLRLALRRTYMVPIAGLAKLKLRDVPDFAALMLPPLRTTAQRAVAAAHAMADAASAHVQVLIDNGLPTTFLDDLRTAAEAVSESIVGRSKHLGRRAGATAGLAAGEKHGRVILQILNALILEHIGNDDQLVAEWTAAKTVRRKPGRPAGSQADHVTPIHSAPVVVTSPATPTPTSVTSPVAAAA